MFEVTSRKTTGKWIDSSLQPDRNPQLRAKLLEDNEYLANMREREGIYKFIIQNFIFNPNDVLCYDKYPIMLMGYDSSPLAAELSQWKYPVTLLVENYYEKRDAKKIMERHNGSVEILIHNFYGGGLPGRKILVWRDEKNSLSPTRKIAYIEYLRNHSAVLILSIPNLGLRERILKEVKNSTQISKFGGTPLIIIYH